MSTHSKKFTAVGGKIVTFCRQRL